MKRPLLFLSCLSATLVSMFSLEAKPKGFVQDWMIEGKAGYFRFTNDDARRIYGGDGIYGLEISSKLKGNTYGWISGSYFHDRGFSTQEHHRTTLTMVPGAIGIKFLFPMKDIDFYFGGGILGTYVKTINHSPYVIRKQEKVCVGAILKGGFIFNIDKHHFIDIFGDYSFRNVRMHNNHGSKVLLTPAEIGGWSVGIGLGLRFGGGRILQPRSSESSRNKTG